jgi:hypothetical protein
MSHKLPVTATVTVYFTTVRPVQDADVRSIGWSLSFFVWITPSMGFIIVLKMADEVCYNTHTRRTLTGYFLYKTNHYEYR